MVFLFHHFKNVLLPLLVSMLSDEKSDANLGDYLFVKSLLSFYDSVFVFQPFDNDVFLGVHWASWRYRDMCFVKFESWQLLFLQIRPALFSVPSPVIPMMGICVCLMFHRSLGVCSLALLFSSSDWIISIDLSFSSLIFLPVQIC